MENSLFSGQKILHGAACVPKRYEQRKSLVEAPPGSGSSTNRPSPHDQTLTFDLAKRGVDVVVATHSLDILKWLEVRIAKHPEDERLVALNRFPNPARTEDDFKLKIAKIKRELSKPFADLYLEGV